MPLPAREARDVALAVGEKAAALLLSAWGNAGTIREKSLATDLVTEWDGRIEALIGAELSRLCPDVPILGEELGARGGGGDDARWVVDPIDGTVNFAHGLPMFAVSIGYEVDGEPEAGAVLAPALGWTFAGARGEGATRNGQPIQVSEVAALPRALLVTGFPYDRGVSPRNNFAAWEHLQRRAGAVRRLGAASLDLCFVACGWIDGYWEFKLKPWDVSAGSAIVRAAGGRVTALDGSAFVSASGEVLATNGRIHDALRAELEGRT
jgi:myo-inositol-1(or 4)-monophosphatase